MAKKLPENGLTPDNIRTQWSELTKGDIAWKSGRFFGYVYHPGNRYYQLINEAYSHFSVTNALNPAIFPSLRKMENEVVSMTADLMQGDKGVRGTMSSGGTESIFLVVKAAKEWAKRKSVENPLMLLATSAHPAFTKAADAIGLTYKMVALDADYQLDLKDLKRQMGENVVLLVASAPAYPQGIIDPVTEIAAIAKTHHCLCHVDACVGGFILPFLRKNGVELPAFDFSVPGVTSISADVHKYGYAAKGASVVLYRNAELRSGQFYTRTDWSGGVYGSPSFMGTRGGGPIAAAWTALHVIGMDGYLQMAREVLDEVNYIKQKIHSEIPEIYIPGNPKATLFSIASMKVDIFEVADELSVLGWTINRQQLPDSLHIILNYIHVGLGADFVHDLKLAVKKARQFSLHKLSHQVQRGAVKGLKKIMSESKFSSLASKLPNNSNLDAKRSAAMYGMMSELSGSESLEKLAEDFLDNLYSGE